MLIDDFKPADVEWCEVCRPHVPGHCDGCGSRFQATDQRYQSQSHHFHPGSIAGIAATIAIHKHLCVDCYRKDHEAVYKRPAPPLPDRGMDPRFYWQNELERKKQGYRDALSAATPEAKQKLEELLELVKQ